MTIAIGVCCAEGSVLLCDSMSIAYRPDGVAEGMLTDAHKIGVLPLARVAYVHSGAWSGGRLEDWQAQGFVADARRLYGLLSACAAAVPLGAVLTAADGGAPPVEQLRRLSAHEVIVAALEASGPRLGLLTDDGERWIDGGVLVAGAPAVWAREQGIGQAPPPLDMAGCRELALAIARDFVADHYQGRTLADFMAEGLVPPVAAPYHVLSIDSTGEVTRWQLPQ